jgi:hypothetical protein
MALYFTGCKHAGENLAEVLKQRPAGLPPLIQMCDALSRNVPKLADPIEILLAHCNARGTLWVRRNFVKVTPNFPEPCQFVLETLREVYGYDAVAQERGMSPEERLHFHQEHSRPVMDKLHAWLKAQFEERIVEPNSGLGQAISYLRKHWQKLTLFLEKPGVPLDNNIVEGGADGRPVHEPDSHLRTQWRQSVRLPERVAAARGGAEAKPVGVDALELPRNPGAACHAYSRVIG